MTTDDRAIRALTDVVAVERMAPGMVRVVTWSDAYVVDARDAGCNCPDKQYHEVPRCKHEWGAILATTDTPAPYGVEESLTTRPVACDGGDRPDGCECAPGWPDDALACFACWRNGFEQPNPER